MESQSMLVSKPWLVNRADLKERSQLCGPESTQEKDGQNISNTSDGTLSRREKESAKQLRTPICPSTVATHPRRRRILP